MTKTTLRFAIVIVLLLVLGWFVIGPWLSTPSAQVPQTPERVAPN